MRVIDLFVRYIIQPTLLILFIPFYPLFWLHCRMNAAICPNCGEDWWTELVGEWDGEMWDCHKCGNHWEIPYEIR